MYRGGGASLANYEIIEKCLCSTYYNTVLKKKNTALVMTYSSLYFFYNVILIIIKPLITYLMFSLLERSNKNLVRVLFGEGSDHTEWVRSKRIFTNFIQQKF